MIKAVIFDMDGLLIDSEPFWRASHKAVLAEMGHHITEDDVRAAAGKRTGDQVEIWRERFGFNNPNREVTDKIVDGVITAIHRNGAPMEGVEELVHLLYERHILMAVASSSSERLIDTVLEKLKIKSYMQAIHSGENEKRGKPFPDVFLSTAKSLGIAPADCLVFEDSLNGVKAAKAAGMKCIAVPELPYDEKTFKAEKPDMIIASLAEFNLNKVKDLYNN